MRVICSHCDNRFESDEEDPRCPKCLRKRAVPVSRKDRKAPIGLNTIEGSEEAHGAIVSSRPLSARIGRFFARAGMGAILFAMLTFGGSLLGMPLESVGLRIYAIVLGGLALGVGWSIFPRLGPVFRDD